jgi:hypothetical protein
MPGGGTSTFLEPDHFEAGLSQAQIEAVIVPRGKFKSPPYLGGTTPFAGLAVRGRCSTRSLCAAGP